MLILGSVCQAKVTQHLRDGSELESVQDKVIIGYVMFCCSKVELS